MRGLSQGFPYARFNFLGLFLRRAGLFLLKAGLLRTVPVQGWSPQGCFPQGLSCPGLAFLRTSLKAVPELLCSGLLSQSLFCSGLLSSEPVLFKAWLFFSHLIVEFRQHLRQQIKHQIEYLGRQNGAFDKDVCHRSSRMYQQC